MTAGALEAGLRLLEVEGSEDLELLAFPATIEAAVRGAAASVDFPFDFESVVVAGAEGVTGVEVPLRFGEVD